METLEQAKATGHPVRRALLEALENGPLTSTQAAKHLQTNTGVTSFHLRQLHRFGSVEEVPGGRGKEKRWGLVQAAPEDGMRYLLHLTAKEMAGLQEQLLDVIAPYFERELDPSTRPRGTKPVALLTRVFLDEP